MTSCCPHRLYSLIYHGVYASLFTVNIGRRMYWNNFLPLTPISACWRHFQWVFPWIHQTDIPLLSCHSAILAMKYYHSVLLLLGCCCYVCKYVNILSWYKHIVVQGRNYQPTWSHTITFQRFTYILSSLSDFLRNTIILFSFYFIFGNN